MTQVAEPSILVKYKVLGSIYSQRRFTISSLAEWMKIEAGVVRYLIENDFAIYVECLEGPVPIYIVKKDARTEITSVLNELYHRVPRTLSFRQPYPPLNLIVLESRVVFIAEHSRIQDEIALCEEFYDFAKKDIGILVAMTNERSRPLVALLEYKLTCVAKILEIIKYNVKAGSDPKPSNTCLTSTDLQTLDGSEFTKEQEDHIQQCEYCQCLAALLPPVNTER